MTNEHHEFSDRHLLGMTPDERGHAVFRAMRLRDHSIRPAATVGRTKLYLAKCDPASAAEVATTLQHFYNDFPHVAARLDAVNVLPLPNGAYAGTSDDHSGRYEISLSERVYGHGQRGLLLDLCAEDYRHGFHRFDRPTGVFEHELGHVLDLSTNMIGSSAMTYYDAQQVSGYAVHGGPEETFAETFANWREGARSGRRAESVLAGVIRAAA